MSSIRRIILGLILGIAFGVGGLAAVPAAAQSTCDPAIDARCEPTYVPCNPDLPVSGMCLVFQVVPEPTPPPPPGEVDFCKWNPAACAPPEPAQP